MTTVVPFRGVPDEPVDAEVVDVALDDQDDEDDYELEEVDERPTSKARELAVAAARPLPSRRQVLDTTRFWSRTAGRVLPWLPVMVVRELRPILRGFGRIVVRWSAWVHCAALAEAVKEAKENERSKAAERLTKRRSARAWGSLVVLVVLAGGMLWLYFMLPVGFWVAALLLVGVFDAVGRAGRGGEARPVVLPHGPIREGIPLSSLRAEIMQSFEAQGFESVTVALPVPVQHGWTVDYHARQAIEDDHLRQLERDLDIRRNGVTQIKEKGNASRGQLHVMLRDPLAEVVPSPELGDLSIYRPLPLGVTASGAVWEEHFLRTHFTVIGASQSGKSSCFWQITDVLRRCPEQELDAIDLTEGPAFGASRRAFRRRGFDEESAHRILSEAVALCKERNAELNRLAEDEDTPDEFEEKWQPTGEEPQRTILIDEFARVAENDKLLPLVEYLLRYGAKAAVTVGIAGQGATLADFGTSVVRGQVMLKIMFACGRDDVLWLFGKDARNSGYRPDLLEPANGESINDAGKAFVMSSMSRTPEPRRAYRLEQAEVRRRDRQLGSRHRSERTVEAVEVPAILAAVERVFDEADKPERMATADLVERLRDNDVVIDAAGLADQLRPSGLRPREERWRPSPKANPVRGYYLADVREAIRGLS